LDSSIRIIYFYTVISRTVLDDGILTRFDKQITLLINFTKGERMRRYLLVVVAAVIAVAGFVIMSSCTTSQGPTGPSGINGINSNQNCTQCHSSSQTIVAKQREWEQSGHSAIESGNSFDYAGTRGGCMPCHNGSIYPRYIKGDKDSTHYVEELANAIGPNCRTCHQIHKDFDSTDWAFNDSITNPVKLIADPTAPKVDFGKGNMCVNCHMARGKEIYDTLTADSVKMFQRTAAHHGPMVDLVLGQGGYEFTGQTVTTAKPAMVDAPHLDLDDGCVTCHMGKAAGYNHTFKPNVKSCKPCHTLTNFDKSGVVTEVGKLQTEIIDSLVSKKMLIRDAASVIGVSVPSAAYAATAKFPKKWVGAAHNLILTLEDRSLGVHNGPYIKYLLKNSLEVLKQ